MYILIREGRVRSTHSTESGESGDATARVVGTVVIEASVVVEVHVIGAVVVGDGVVRPGVVVPVLVKNNQIMTGHHVVTRQRGRIDSADARGTFSATHEDRFRLASTTCRRPLATGSTWFRYACVDESS